LTRVELGARDARHPSRSHKWKDNSFKRRGTLADSQGRASHLPGENAAADRSLLSRGRPHRCKRSATSAGELSLVRCPPFVDFENPTAAVICHEERSPLFHASAGLVPGAQLCVASIDTVASYEPPCGFLFRSRRRGHGIAAGRTVAVSLASRPAASCKAPGC
jgi:hypothetical protein